jgi:ribonuclease P protein component
MVEHTTHAGNLNKGRLFALPKHRKLRQQKIIRELFTKSSSVFLHPYKLLFIQADKETVPQLVFSVPKRNFKKAVDRNRIRRQMVEAYRLNAPLLPQESCAYIAITYIAKEKNLTDFMQLRLIALLKKFNAQLLAKKI